MKTTPVPRLRIGIITPNLVVGDLTGNVKKLVKAYDVAVARGAELVLAPELAVCGYPPKDDLLYAGFVKACMAATLEIARAITHGTGECSPRNVPFGFGTPWLTDVPGPYGQVCYNAFVVVQCGRVIFRTHKRHPAQGGVFNEHRVHVSGNPQVFHYRNISIGIPICEDIWHDDVVHDLHVAGAEVFYVPNGSPTYVGKPAKRHALVRRHVDGTGSPMLYNNYVGGQDEHAFEGGAFFLNPGDVRATVISAYWHEAVTMVNLVEGEDGRCAFLPDRDFVPFEEPADDDFRLDATLTTLQDYLLKSSSIRKVVVGVSGGVDSAVVLALCLMAFGRENVIAVSMPSRHNSDSTKNFAQVLCDNLEIPLRWWPIGATADEMVAAYEREFGHPFKVIGNAAYENIQSRIRGLVLMAIANREHAMVVSTGNRSEMAMGYATLYGDMNGGFNPLKTVLKTEAYVMAHTLNRRLGFEAIPVALIYQKPSAELDDGQFDENALPPYPVLDAILRRFMDERADVDDILTGRDVEVLGVGGVTDKRVCFVPTLDWCHGETGDKPDMQRWALKGTDYHVHADCVVAVVRRLLANQFKRYQSPPGSTNSPTGLDDGWDFPIVNHWKPAETPGLSRGKRESLAA